MLSERERITLLMMRGYGDRVRSFQEVMDLFNETFPNRNPISRSTVQKTVRRFEETGSVKDRPRSGRPRDATNEEKSLDVLLSVTENPHTSIPKLEQEHGIAKGSIHKILKRNSFHPYKIFVTQELTEGDFDRRIEFCNEMITRYDRDPNWFNFIIFSDEATFELNGAVNRHNCRYWSDVNPHWMTDLRTQYPQKLNVWAGLCRRGIIGPFFLYENFNAQNYLNLLRDQVVPAIENLYPDNIQDVWFQQDGAPPHFALVVRQYLHEAFTDRWIGRRGAIEWPARSPDLTPLDYFLWGYLKNKVYETKPNNLQELQARITNTATLITPEQIINTLNNFYERLAHCITAEGRQFEHLIN